jgi:hypothetical protein
MTETRPVPETSCVFNKKRGDVKDKYACHLKAELTYSRKYCYFIHNKVSGHDVQMYTVDRDEFRIGIEIKYLNF